MSGYDYKVANISARGDAEMNQSDLFIYAIGYEKRSSYIREKINPSSICLGVDYESAGISDYDTNLESFLNSGDSATSKEYRCIKENVTRLYNEAELLSSVVNVVVDVSCLDRSVLAEIMLCLFACVSSADTLSFLYTTAEFQVPGLSLSPTKSFGPASHELAGFIGNPYTKKILIMGLGYEYGAALNVMNLIEPTETKLFYPEGNDPRYIPYIKKANFDFDFGMTEYDVAKYSLNDMCSLHGALRDIVYSYQHHSSLMIVPFGPKIFSALAIVIAASNKEQVSFMRYSVESINSFPHVESSGAVFGFQLSDFIENKKE